MNEEVKQAQKLCPRCKKPYIGYPAISRMDNETRICPDCGREEAIIAMKTGKRKLVSD